MKAIERIMGRVQRVHALLPKLAEMGGGMCFFLRDILESELAMHWTKELPKEPGYYALRVDGGYTDEGNVWRTDVSWINPKDAKSDVCISNIVFEFGDVKRHGIEFSSRPIELPEE